MIIIFSAKNDITTNEICNWLKYYKHDFKVVFAEDFLQRKENEYLSIDCIEKYLESIFNCHLSKIKTFWCRKWGAKTLLNQTKNDKITEELSEKLKTTSLKEINTFFEFIFNILPKEKIINNFFNSNNSKFNQLIVAKSCNLEIPETYVVNSKKQLKNILKPNDSYITKAMHEGIGFNFNEDSYTTFTEIIDFKKISSDFFLPSLIQKEIKKKYEIRSFVLGEKIYSMAIFSQDNNQTTVDYRQYDLKRPNKRASYKLPTEIKQKVLSFMNKMNLKTGSIDFIVDKDDNYFFLEVNPYGQFGMVSKPNNYNLENEFAKYLIEHGRNK